MKILAEMYPVTRKLLLNFESHPNVDIGNFWLNFYRCRMGR